MTICQSQSLLGLFFGLSSLSCINFFGCIKTFLIDWYVLVPMSIIVSLVRWDVYLFYLINTSSSSVLNQIMLLITEAGSVLFVLAISVSFFLLAKKFTLKKLALILMIGLIVQVLIVFPLKSAFDRPRPYEYLRGSSIDGICSNCPAPKVLVQESNGSFPSAHSGTYFVVASILFSLRKKKRLYYLSIVRKYCIFQ